MLAVFLSLLAGALILLFIQALLFKLWFTKQGTTSPPAQWNVEFDLQHIANVIQNLDSDMAENESQIIGKSTASFLNIVMLFLFQELRDDAKVRAQVLSRINNEISEVLTSKIKSRIIKTLNVHNFSAGTSPPRIRNIHINKLRMCPDTKLFRKLHIVADIVYRGCGKLALQASTFLGKNIYISVEVTKLTGKIIFILNRQPQTHWGFCFESEPEIEFNVVSSFQHRSLPHLTKFVTTILKRTLRKKHTKPNYRRRYSPLFKEPIVPQAPNQQFFVCREPLNKGKLIVKLISANRVVKMNCKATSSSLYCTVSLGGKEWNAECCPLKQSVAFDATIHGVDAGIGLNFKVEADGTPKTAGVIVEDIHKNSPAADSNIRQGDLITAINNKRVSSFKTALAASLSGANRAKLSIIRPLIKWNKIFTSGEASQDMTMFEQETNKEATFVEEEEFLVLEEFFESEETPPGEDEDGFSCPTTPTCLTETRSSPCYTDTDSVLRTQPCCLSIAPYWDEYFLMNMQETHKFFTVCLWREDGRLQSNPVLVGYCNLNVVDVILQCISTTNNTYNDSVLLTLPSDLKWQENIVPPIGSLPYILPKLKCIAGEVKVQFTYCLENKETCDHSFAISQTQDPEKCSVCQKTIVHKSVYICTICGILRHEKCLNPATRRSTQNSRKPHPTLKCRPRSATVHSPKDSPRHSPRSSFSFLKGSEKKAAVLKDRLQEIESDLQDKIALRRTLLATRAQCQQVPVAIQEQLVETEDAIKCMTNLKDKLTE